MPITTFDFESFFFHRGFSLKKKEILKDLDRIKKQEDFVLKTFYTLYG
ncbi:hypothetical protein LEP1GSC062_2598 [Leptospira alexanderi serovar Manhao 3 str. L 60]|uniref:Uncharacterized protein n=1 Tax=Leptospira alexanderi serovar Manhao 3 str. L 60 TaxID=1049759 RepID=V6IBQ7_9LEPT|nr:hypothetical protein LEP1GSC062_2598 [Leptospira alexanderi serovar Manhao 3 str. L 60]